VSDERVIEYLQFRGQAQPPTDLVPRIMAAVDTAPVGRSPFAAFLPAAVAIGLVAVVAIVALILGQEPNVGPGPTDSVEPRPSPASVEELRAALESAIDVLREAPGVEGVSTASVLDELSGATWFSWRPNGDQVAITRTDVDVAQTGWWLDPDGEPPARGENVTTTIHVLVGDESYEADADADGWVAGSREDVPPVVTIPTGILDDAVPVADAFGTADGDVTVTRDPDGTTTWVLTAPYRDGTAISEWGIAPDGGLRAWSGELVGVSPTVEDAPFITSHRTEFAPLSDPEPIEPPDTDLPPDPAALGLPPDFPLAAPGAALDVDYVAYVETTLNAMEAYHWNTENIDWEAARAAALNGLPDDPTAGQAHQRIQEAIQTFDTFNTVLLRPEDVPPGGGAPTGSAGPSGERLGDVGYLHLPALDAGGPEDVEAYLRVGRTAMESIESTAPACGWIVDLRETAFGAYPPLFGVVAGLVGEGRVITFDSALGDWWVEVNDDGTLTIDGEERTADILDSPAVAAATADDERQTQEFDAVLASEAPYLPADPDAPVVVLTSNVTTAAGEQLVVGFRGRPATRVIGGVTSGSPHGQMSLEMVDGARLRFPVSTVVDRAGTTYDSNLVPDETVAVVTGSDGDDPAIDAAVEWLEGQPGCS
jgi:carboxyl-terminal processing protease